MQIDNCIDKLIENVRLMYRFQEIVLQCRTQISLDKLKLQIYIVAKKRLVIIKKSNYIRMMYLLEIPNLAISFLCIRNVSKCLVYFFQSDKIILFFILCLPDLSVSPLPYLFYHLKGF